MLLHRMVLMHKSRPRRIVRIGHVLHHRGFWFGLIGMDRIGRLLLTILHRLLEVVRGRRIGSPNSLLLGWITVLGGVRWTSIL